MGEKERERILEREEWLQGAGKGGCSQGPGAMVESSEQENTVRVGTGVYPGHSAWVPSHITHG